MNPDRVRVVVVTAVLILLVGSLSLVGVVLTRDDDYGRSAEPIDFPGLTGRESAAVAWVGDRLFVHVDDRDGSDRVWLVDPEDGGGIVLPPPPIEDPLEPIPALLTVGDEVLLVGSHCDEVDPSGDTGVCVESTLRAAAFDLEQGRWRRLPVPDRPAEGDGRETALGVTSDGRAVFRLGEVGAPSYWIFSPDDGAWRELDVPRGRSDEACLAGDSLVVASAGFARPDIALLDLGDPSARWVHTNPALSLRISESAQGPMVSCTADLVVLHHRGRDLHLHSSEVSRAGEAWDRAAPTPGRGRSSMVLEADGRLVFLSASPPNTPSGHPARTYDPETDVWTERAHLPYSSYALVSTGDGVAGFAAPSDQAPWSTPVLLAVPIEEP